MQFNLKCCLANIYPFLRAISYEQLAIGLYETAE